MKHSIKAGIIALGLATLPLVSPVSATTTAPTGSGTTGSSGTLTSPDSTGATGTTTAPNTTTGTDTTSGTSSVEVERDRDGFDWGWLGLLGLIGLAGLGGKKREETRYTTTDPDATTRSTTTRY